MMGSGLVQCGEGVRRGDRMRNIGADANMTALINWDEQRPTT